MVILCVLMWVGTRRMSRAWTGTWSARTPFALLAGTVLCVYVRSLVVCVCVNLDIVCMRVRVYVCAGVVPNSCGASAASAGAQPDGVQCSVEPARC